MSSTQAKVALDKEKHPERYCPTRRCLWRTGGAHCPRHGGTFMNRPVPKFPYVPGEGVQIQAQQRYHVHTIKFTWRPEKQSTFDQELGEYLSKELEAGYVLDRIEWVTDPGEPGYVADIKAVVLTVNTR